MIYYIRGILKQVRMDAAVLETAGVGYELFCCAGDLAELSGKTGQEVILYTHLIHREDSMSLYGFVTETSRNGFLELLKVEGIGPKLALKILSFYPYTELAGYITNEDLTALKKISGVGPKVAAKMILDLKNRLPSGPLDERGGYENDLLQALIQLGYDDVSVRSSIKSIRPLSDDFQADFKKLLKILSGK